MKVYTKTGDKGLTSRYDGKRVPKDDITIKIVGKIDTVLATLDSCLSIVKEPFLEEIQEDLWQLAGELSCLGERKPKKLVGEKDVKKLESQIDNLSLNLKHFVRFKGEKATRINFSRVIVRELEVELAPLLRETLIREEAYKFLNRLSDYLYVLACKHSQGLKELK